MPKSENAEKNQHQETNIQYSEANEMGHERNQAAKAQKQMASQETTGVLEQE